MRGRVTLYSTERRGNQSSIVGFRVGYHIAEPIGERGGESYDVERGNGTECRCYVADAEQLRNLKRKAYEELKWRPADRRAGGRAKRITTRKVKQEDASKIGTDRVSEA